MHGFKGERVLMRIHIGERDKWKGKPLYEVIVELLRSRHYAGATAHLRTDRVELLSLDLPIVVEVVETAAKIEAILPEIDAMITGGLITLERAKVIMYRADVPPERRTGSWLMDMTGDWTKEEAP